MNKGEVRLSGLGCFAYCSQEREMEEVFKL